MKVVLISTYTHPISLGLRFVSSYLKAAGALLVCRGRDVLFQGQLHQLEIVFEDLAQHFFLRPVEGRLLGIGAARLAGNGRPGPKRNKLLLQLIDSRHEASHLRPHLFGVRETALACAGIGMAGRPVAV